MTVVSDLAKSAPAEDVDRNMALLVYGLLFLGAFFPVPAWIGAVIAYTRRKNVPPLIANHHRFQLFIFWVATVAGLLTAMSILAAIGGIFAKVVLAVVHSRWHRMEIATLPPITIDSATVAFVTGFLILYVLTGLWLLLTSAYGFVRLASQREIHHPAH
jgi:uncharacterized membrane protein